MNNRANRYSDMFGRVQTFGQNNAADFTAGSEGAKRFANLNPIITNLAKARAAQQGGGVAGKIARLEELRFDVQNITRTARAINQDEPGLTDQFPPPVSDSEGDLLAAADNILARLVAGPDDDDATKAAKAARVAQFVAHELPADFATYLQTDRTNVDKAQSDVETDDEEGVASTSAIERLIKAGMKEINYLDAIMHNKYSRSPDKLRAWQSARHIERAAHRENTPAPAPAPTPAKPA